MNKHAVSQMYVNALYEVSEKSDFLTHAKETLNVIDYMLTYEELMKVLSIPVIDIEKRQDVIEPVFKTIESPKVKNFITTILKNDKIDLLPQIKEKLENKIMQVEGHSVAIVESALPLTESEEIELKRNLEKRFSKKIKLSCSVNDTIISGFKVTIGNLQLDATLNTLIEKFKQKFKD